MIQNPNHYYTSRRPIKHWVTTDSNRSPLIKNYISRLERQKGFSNSTSILINSGCSDRARLDTQIYCIDRFWHTASRTHNSHLSQTFYCRILANFHQKHINVYHELFVLTQTSLSIVLDSWNVHLASEAEVGSSAALDTKYHNNL